MINQLEFRYPVNYIYFVLPLLSLFIFIMAYRKKETILEIIKLNIKPRFKFTRIILSTLSLILIVFSLLGPQIFKGYQEVNKEGLDIYVLVDTSKSMLVDDVKPDRINRARKIIENLIDNLEGDRIGLIPFSSDAYIQMPLTDDYQIARMFLDVIDTDMIAGGGTNIAAAISLAEKSFEDTSRGEKVILILSDGEEHEKNSLGIVQSIGNSNSENPKIYTIGIGTDKGGLVPELDAETNEKIGYKKDQSGEFVISHLSADTLKELAEAGGGNYYQSTLTGSEINSLVADIANLKRDVIKTSRVRKFRQLYQYFLGAGLLLFLIAYLLPERRKEG